MGCFGMITSIKVRCVQLEETTESAPISKIIENFSEIVHSAPRVRMWWIPLDGRTCISRISPTSSTQSASKEHSYTANELPDGQYRSNMLSMC